jgi:hypothetical protein
MGAHCSIHNDTLDETVMVFIGVNTKVLQPLLWSITGMATVVSGGVAIGSLPAVVRVSMLGGQAMMLSVNAMTAAAGGMVSASNYVLDALQTRLVQDLTKGGYHKCLPGQTYTLSGVTPGLNLRAWLVRIQKTETSIFIQRCDASVWTGNVYRVMDQVQFRHWKSQETIPLLRQPTTNNNNSTEEDPCLTEDGDFTLLESDMVQCHYNVLETTTGATSTCSKTNHDHHDDDDNDETWIQVDTVTTTTTDEHS